MIALMWKTSAAIRRYLRAYMPTNIALGRLRTRRGLKWAMPAAILIVPAYLFLAAMFSLAIDRGGPAWLHLLVVLYVWNAYKFAALAIWTPILWVRHRPRAIRRGMDPPRLEVN